MGDGHRLVVDCSAVVPWFLDDEASAWSEALLDRIGDLELVVPGLWHLEFTNVLLTAERRKRIGKADREAMLLRASRLPLTTDTHVVPLVEIARLAREHALTTYDAAYLELAQRMGCPLATQDKVLRTAARKLGLAYAGERR